MLTYCSSVMRQTRAGASEVLVMHSTPAGEVDVVGAGVGVLVDEGLAAPSPSIEPVQAAAPASATSITLARFRNGKPRHPSFPRSCAVVGNIVRQMLPVTNGRRQERK